MNTDSRNQKREMCIRDRYRNIYVWTICHLYCVHHMYIDGFDVHCFQAAWENTKSGPGVCNVRKQIAKA